MGSEFLLLCNASHLFPTLLSLMVKHIVVSPPLGALDPLSPSLFLLCAKGLSALIH